MRAIFTIRLSPRYAPADKERGASRAVTFATPRRERKRAPCCSVDTLRRLCAELRRAGEARAAIPPPDVPMRRRDAMPRTAARASIFRAMACASACDGDAAQCVVREMPKY